jgi:aminocarboxymuconate-semialdehyde decarboxylase
VVAHLGGLLPWLRERIAVYTGPTDQFAGQLDHREPLGSYLDRLYVDSVSYGLPSLEHCRRHLGADRILFGSDHPFARYTEPRRLLDQLDCSPEERERISWRNAADLLGLRQRTSSP